jgi:hypothetical protein
MNSNQNKNSQKEKLSANKKMISITLNFIDETSQKIYKKEY